LIWEIGMVILMIIGFSLIFSLMALDNARRAKSHGEKVGDAIEWYMNQPDRDVYYIEEKFVVVPKGVDPHTMMPRKEESEG